MRNPVVLRCCVPVCKTRLVSRLHFHQMLSLVDRQRQRLFAVHILARAHRRDRNKRMPMVRRAADDRINILLLHQIEKIANTSPPAASSLRGCQMRFIHIANRDDLSAKPTALPASPVPCPPQPISPIASPSPGPGGLGFTGVTSGLGVVDLGSSFPRL